MKKNKRHLVRAVEDCSMVNYMFKSKSSAKKFINSFNASYKNPNDGWWVDLVVFDIYGEIYDDGKLILDQTTASGNIRSTL